MVSSAGALLPAEVAATVGLTQTLPQELAPWRRPSAVHDPGKIIMDLAVTLTIGGSCPADVAGLRGQQQLFGPVASDPTISRMVDVLAGAGEPVLSALRRARAATRARVWQLGGTPSQPQQSDGRRLLVLDVDATLVTAHSEKEDAAATWKKGFGFHPLLAYLDHGAGGTGEPLAGVLRPGNAGANTAADHQTVVNQALSQLPACWREPDEAGRRPVLVRTDAAGASHAFAQYLHDQGMQYSLGFPCSEQVQTAVLAVPEQGWTPAYDADGEEREGAWVAEITGMLDLTSWPAGMRVLVHKERPHPGVQLTFTDVDGHRFTCFATNTRRQQCPQLAELERRHRAHARVEDRIKAAKDTGLANLPYHDTAANRLWCEIVALAQDLLAWTQRLALTGAHAVAEPKRLRYRLLNCAGRLATSGQQRRLRLARTWPWASDLAEAFTRLHSLAASAAPG